MARKIFTSPWETAPEHIDQFSYIRVLACFCIIILNALFSANVYFDSAIIQGEVLWTRIMENEFMWAMPCFLMVTGALLLDPGRDLSLKKIFGKYLRRILLALVCFTLLFQILGCWKEGESGILQGWMEDLFLGRSWIHMWYLYLMIGIYLMVPFYQMVARAAGEKLMDYLLLVLLLFTSIVPVFAVFGLGLAFYIPTYVVYPLYVFLGFRLYRRPLPLWASWALLVCCTAGLLALTYARFGTDMMAAWEADAANQLDVLTGYSSLLVVGQSAGVFGLLCRVKAPAGSLLREADGCTFGIYLIHMIGVHMVLNWWGFNPYMYGPFTFILMAAAFFVLAGVITWALRKIPKLNLL